MRANIKRLPIFCGIVASHVSKIILWVFLTATVIADVERDGGVRGNKQKKNKKKHGEGERKGKRGQKK